MNNSVAVRSPQSVIKDINVQKMIVDRLGKRAGQFTTSLLSLVNSNAKIAECTPMTVIQAALTAAAMDLPINQNLGVAYIVPYKNNKNIGGKWVTTMEAQFQMGWKGFVQLAQRSGKFATINTTDVREGELASRDRMTGKLTFEWNGDDEERGTMSVIGYLAYFELLNGFKKSLYMTKAEIEAHATRYSQAFKGSKDNSNRSSFKTPWQTDFDLMAQKTVLKQLLSKYAPLSTEMQEAVVADQSVNDGEQRTYIDAPDDMHEVDATEEEKDAIVVAAQEAGEGAESTSAAHADLTEAGEDGTAATDDLTTTITPPKEEKPAPKPKKSVKEQVAERGWTKDSKQSKLLDDDDRTKNNPGA